MKNTNLFHITICQIHKSKITIKPYRRSCMALKYLYFVDKINKLWYIIIEELRLAKCSLEVDCEEVNYLWQRCAL